MIPQLEFTEEERNILQQSEGNATHPAAYDNKDNKLEFYVGFLLDGLAKYRNLSVVDGMQQFGRLHVAPQNPQVHYQGTFIRQTALTIKVGKEPCGTISCI